jgi:hypothetical protein
MKKMYLAHAFQTVKVKFFVTHSAWNVLAAEINYAIKFLFARAAKSVIIRASSYIEGRCLVCSCVCAVATRVSFCLSAALKTLIPNPLGALSLREPY